MKYLSSPLLLLPLVISQIYTPVLAQQTEQQQDSLETIQITGSRRSMRSVADSTVPVDVVSVEEMTTTGQLEFSQIMANLIPSFNYPNAAIADGTDHARPAVLRGLAPDHTLVLINGKRRHSGALLNLNGTVGRGSSAVDLNMIPSAAIKRVEILRDGAAAQYGSDAIAGVINIILKDTSGGSLDVSYGQYDTTMDGVKQLNSTSIDSQGNLSFDLGGERTRTDGETLTIGGSWGTELSHDGYLNLAFESRNSDPTNRAGFDPREQYARDSLGNLDPRELSFDRYNHKYGKAEIDNIALFYNMGLKLNDTQLYSFGSYGQRDGLAAGFYRLPKDSRNIPAIYPDGFLPHIASDVTDTSIVLGASGELADWSWDLSANHGKNDFSLAVKNSLNASMGANSPTEFDDGSLIYQQNILNLEAKSSMDMGLSNPVFVALGTEYRHENYQIEAGEEASYITILDNLGNPVAAGGAQVLPGFSPSSEVDTSRHNYAAYVEFDTDLSDNFNMVLASRFEDYSDFGSTFTSKLAARWAINYDLALRGAASTGFRAPSLAQSTYTSVATVFENGIPKDVGIFPVTNNASQALGAQPLEPEESVNLTLGLVYQLGNFNFTLDAYQIEINDRIVLSENISGPAVVAILQAAGENTIQSMRYFTNAIDSTTQGLDLVSSYQFDLDNMGQVKLNMALNINDTKVDHVIDNPPELSVLGSGYEVFAQREISRFEKGTPKNKLNLSAIWDLDAWKFTLRSTHYGEVTDAGSTPAGDEIIEANWITDLDVGYAFSEQLRVSLGANNVFDVYHQDTVSNVGFSTFNQIFPYSGFSAYSTDGRFLYGKIGYHF
jgi:iron complex outermembrane recepter protein